MASPNGQCYRFIAILSVNVIVTPCISIDIIYVRVSIAHDSSHWSYYSYWEKVYNETIGELKKELGIGLFILSLVCDPPRDVSVLWMSKNQDQSYLLCVYWEITQVHFTDLYQVRTLGKQFYCCFIVVFI